VTDTVGTIRGEYDYTVTVAAPDGLRTDDDGVSHGRRGRRAKRDRTLRPVDAHGRVTTVQSLGDDYVDVRVADDGPGIPADRAAIVTGDVEPARTQHLTGLGPWTARRVT